jgi:hypothetical protein
MDKEISLDSIIDRIKIYCAIKNIPYTQASRIFNISYVYFVKILTRKLVCSPKMAYRMYYIINKLDRE